MFHYEFVDGEHCCSVRLISCLENSGIHSLVPIVIGILGDQITNEQILNM